MNDSAGPGEPRIQVGPGLSGALETLEWLLDPAGKAVDGEARGDIDLIRALEDVKNAACAAQAVAAVRFARAQRAEQARLGVPAERLGRGVAEQIALARRESPHAGAVFLGMAAMLVSEMPRTLAAMSAGVLSEFRARIVVQETSCVSREVRRDVDEVVCGDLSRLAVLGTRRLGNLVRRETYRREPTSVVAKISRAESDRFVSLRPAPDCMARLSALLPVAQGVSLLAALRRAGDAAQAAGDPRTRGQVMADELVVRVTGQSSAEAVPIALHLIMPGHVLLSGDADAVTDRGVNAEGEVPGGILGYGPVPAPLARRLVGTAPRLGSWVRRLYAAPSGGLIAMESRRRFFPRGLAEFVTIRDDICRTPFCDAPIRHIDHIVAKADGGSTSAANAQGLCERCNHAKQAPGWSERPDDDGADAGSATAVSGAGRHVTITTPSGHRYISPAPDSSLRDEVPHTVQTGRMFPSVRNSRQTVSNMSSDGGISRTGRHTNRGAPCPSHQVSCTTESKCPASRRCR